MSGKTTLARWLTAFAGIHSGGKSITGTTQVGLSRYLGYYSSLPVWFDEYRNELKTQSKDSFLRNVYDRQGSGKGTRSGQGTREEVIRGTLLLSGEETPHDNALMTRAIIIQLHKHNRKENDIYYKIQSELKTLSYLALKVIKNRQEMISKVLSYIDDGTKFLCKNYNLDQRIAVNYATAMAGYFALFGEDEKLLDFTGSYAKNDKSEKDSEQVINVFFDILGSLHASGRFTDQFYKYDPSKKEVYLYMSGAYNTWAPEYQKIHGRPPFKMTAVRNYLTEEDFYKAGAPRRVGKTLRWCLVFDSDLLPDEAKFMLNLTEYELDGV